MLAIFGWASRYWNRRNSFSGYMAKNSFGFYILHYPVLMVCCYLLHSYTTLPIAAKYAIAMAVGFVVTWLLNEAVKRIPVIRFLVLGLRKDKLHDFQADHR